MTPSDWWRLPLRYSIYRKKINVDSEKSDQSYMKKEIKEELSYRQCDVEPGNLVLMYEY